MVFNVTADKMVMIDGKIITIKAGKLETTDRLFIDALSNCKGVTQEQVKSVKKKAD